MSESDGRFEKGLTPWNKGRGCQETISCIICGTVVHVSPSKRGKRYCSKHCAMLGWAGQRRSRATEFQKGHSQNEIFPLGAIRIRTDRSGNLRAWIKVSDDKHSSYDWRANAVVVWERVHGSIPHGFVVHHKDRDTLNDIIPNLELQSRADHMKEHKHEFETARQAGVSRKRDSRTSSPVLRTRGEQADAP